MNQEDKIRYVMQGPAEKYGGVPPKLPVVLAKQCESAAKTIAQSKSASKTGKISGKKN